VIEFLDALGSAILRSLVAIRAGLIISAAAFLELAIAAANESERLTGFLKPFFAIVAIAFGALSVAVAALFAFRQFRPARDP
jgi:hypothetical protein